MSQAKRRAVLQQTQEVGISICCIGTSCKLADPSQSQAQIEIAKAHIDLASDIGSPLIRVFAGSLPSTLPRDTAHHTLVDSLSQLAQYAQSRNVIVCLESHDSFCDPQNLASVMSHVNHPNAGLLWDIMHTLRQGKISAPKSFALLAKWIRHVHIHDGLLTLDTLKMLPIGRGEFDHLQILQLLRDANYPGFISGEWIDSCMDPEFFTDHLQQEIHTLKKLEAQLS
jgi:sugar phosphate isomerase/epimerase